MLKFAKSLYVSYISYSVFMLKIRLKLVSPAVCPESKRDLHEFNERNITLYKKDLLLSLQLIRVSPNQPPSWLKTSS